MEQKAYLAVVGMLNSFPQGTGNPDLTMGTYEAVLSTMSSQAVIEAAQRFVMGDVEGQSKTFAPSIAEFVTEARKRQEYIDLKNKPRIPVYRHHTGAPFYIRQEKVRTKYQDCAILAENIGLAEYQARIREFPPGHALVCAVATVFGPPALEIAKKA